MGVHPPTFVAELKSRRIPWFATATTVVDAKKAEAAGADVIIAQGMEAGGHRGAFDATKAKQRLVGLIALVPAIVDAVRIPVVAAGGIGDGRADAGGICFRHYRASGVRRRRSCARQLLNGISSLS